MRYQLLLFHLALRHYSNIQQLIHLPTRKILFCKTTCLLHSSQQNSRNIKLHFQCNIWQNKLQYLCQNTRRRRKTYKHNEKNDTKIFANCDAMYHFPFLCCQTNILYPIWRKMACICAIFPTYLHSKPIHLCISDEQQRAKFYRKV